VTQLLARIPERLQYKLTGGPTEIDGQRLDGPSQMLNALVSALKTKPIEACTPGEARAMNAKLASTRPPRAVRHVVDRHADGVPVRLYYPDDATGPLGALVYFHGGGWVLGSIESHDYPASRLAALARCVVVSVDYRLAPEHPYPAALDDAERAHRWVVEHAASIGVDPARVAVGGDSAGGNLAAALCQRMLRSDGPLPAHQLLVYPVTDLTSEAPSYALFADGFLLGRGGMRWFIDHYVPDPARRAEPDASPLLADDLSGLPPAHVVIAGFDPLRDEGVAYAERLRDAGVAVELAEYPTTFHGFFNASFALPVGARAVERAAASLGRALAG